MTAGDPEFLREIVEMYLDDSATLVTQLEACVARQDGPELKVVAHKLKGSSLNMGVQVVAELAKRLEEYGKADQCGAPAREAVAALGREMIAVREAFEALVREAA